MLLGEPAPTQGDLHFSVFGIPVRVHPFFWLIALLLGMNAGGEGESPLIPVLVWIIALFVSILWHELGHALTQRAYGFRPWVVLYGMGGLACYNPAETYRARGSDPSRQILISLAGPGAGFLLAAAVTGAILLSGHEVRAEIGAPYGIEVWSPKIIGSLYFTHFLNHLLFINILWGMVNLLPVYPLDGGQVAREILVKFNPYEGIRQSLILSIFTGAMLAAVGLLVWKSIFVGLLFGYLAYSSYATLQAYTR